MAVFSVGKLQALALAILLGCGAATASLPDLAVEAHSVKIWNLVGPCSVESDIPGASALQCAYISNPFISALLQRSCEFAPIVWQPLGGCPNVGAFEASDVDFNVSGESLGGDTIATVISTIGMPAAVQAYFEASARFNFSINGTRNPQNESGWLPDYWGHGPHFNFKAAMDLRLNAFAQALAIPTIIEWEDVKGDGKFDPLVSRTVSSFSLAQPHASHFKAMAVNVKKGPNDSLLYSLNASTADSVFSISVETSNRRHPGADGELRAPNGAKISVQIRNYPYKGKGTKLALQAVLLNANAGAEIDVSSDDSAMLVDGGKAQGVFTWKDSATVRGGGRGQRTVAVAASALTNETAAKEVTFSAASAVMFQSGGYSAKVVYYTFQAEQPSEIVWDPELRVEAAGATGSLSGLNTVLLIFGAVALAAGLAFLAWRAYRQRQLRRKQHEGYRALLSAYDLE